MEPNRVDTAADRAYREAAAQGLPARVTDAAALDRTARLVVASSRRGDADERVAS